MKYRTIKVISAIFIAAAVICILAGAVGGWAVFGNWLNNVRGELIGQSFEVSQYDNSGNKTLTLSGEKISIGLLENSANLESEDSGFKSEVLEITVDGKVWNEVGNTLIFAETGLEPVVDFSMPETIESTSGSTGLMPADKVLNKFRNLIGDAKTIVIYSQLGDPIAVYQGNEVYIEVPSDLPKTTRLVVDGKSLYINRANYDIISTSLVEEG